MIQIISDDEIRAFVAPLRSLFNKCKWDDDGFEIAKCVEAQKLFGSFVFSPPGAPNGGAISSEIYLL